MRLASCFIALSFATLILSGQQQEEIRVSCAFNDVTFEDFVHELEKKNNLRFFYLENWIAGLKVTVKADSITIHDLMTQTLKSTRLGFVIKSPDKIYLLPDKTFIYGIPDYFISDASRVADTLSDESESLAEKRYLKGREPDMVETIVIGNHHKARPGRNVKISGQLP